MSVRPTLLLILVLILSGCGVFRRPAQSDFGQPIPVPVLPATVAATIDTNQRHQMIEGFGVNINGAYWNEGAFAPALDALSDELGATVFRIVIETTEWELVNDDADPRTYNWAAYDEIYQGPQFRSLWSIMRYLEAKPGTTVLLNIMGPLPAWMGDGRLDSANEAEWIEMITSLVVYAREREELRLELLSPLNEIDLGDPEGPRMEPNQYVRVMRLLSERLVELGHAEIGLVGPEPAFSSGTDNYMRPLLRDPQAMALFAHIAVHDYAGQLDDKRSLLEGTPYADRSVWVTEYSQWCTGCEASPARSDEWSFGADTAEFLLRYLQQGVSAAMIYDGVDGYYAHHGTFDYWGVLEYNPDTGAFRPRPRFYAAAQIFHFVQPGMVRVEMRSATEGMNLTAFIDPLSGDLTLVGRNATANPVTLETTISGLAQLPALTLYQTTATASLAPEAVVQEANEVRAVIAPDSIFAISSRQP